MGNRLRSDGQEPKTWCGSQEELVVTSGFGNVFLFRRAKSAT